MLTRIFSIMFAFLLLVSFHELGHFLAAKWARVKVLKFALGFPPWIFSVKLGETVYSMGMTLMGGFVRMQGEEMVVGEGEQLDDRDYRKKPIWKRAIIIAAGPIFSLILALPITMYCLSMGVLQPPPILGPQPVTSQFAKADLAAGDRIIEIDGTPIYSRPALVMHSLLNSDQPMAVKVLRTDDQGKTTTLEKTVQPLELSLDIQDQAKLYRAGLDQPIWKHSVKFKDPGFTFRSYAAVAAISPSFKKDGPPTPAAGSELKPDDEIVAVNGQPVSSFTDLQYFVRVHGDQALVLSVCHASEPDTIVDIELKPVNASEDPKSPNYLLGIVGTTYDVVTAVTPGSAAEKAGIQPGMRMEFYNKDGTHAEVASRANPLNPQTGEFHDLPGRTFLPTRIGPEIPLSFNKKEPHETWNAYASRLMESRRTEPDLVFMVQAEPDSLREQMYLPVEISTERRKLPAGYLHAPARDFEVIDDHQEYQQIRGVSNLVGASWDYFVTQIFMMLQSLKKIFGDLFNAGRGVAGPLGIGKMLWAQGEFHGEQWNLQFNKYLLFIAFISINLGIMNLLPIPILDGGHLLMLLIEAIRRKPLTRVFVERFQIVGMVLLLGLFLFATSMDIFHLF